VSQAKKALSVPGVPEEVAMIAMRKVIAPPVGLQVTETIGQMRKLSSDNLPGC